MTSATPETRQQRRRRARREAKRARPTKLTEFHHRLQFKAAKQMFAKVREQMDINFLLGPMAVQLAMMTLASLLGPYRSRGKGGKFPRRGPSMAGNTSSHIAHQGKQERLRRVVGGWAFQRRLSGLTKRTALAHASVRAFSVLNAAEQLRDVRGGVFA